MIVAVGVEDELVTSARGIYAPGELGLGRVRRVFEQVVVVARVKPGPPPRNSVRVDGDGVRVEAIAGDGLAGGVALVRACVRVVRGADVVLLRGPGAITTALREALRVARRPYAVEVLGEPGGNLLRRGLARAQLREQVAGAAATRFATTAYLQDRYPPRPGTFTVAAPEVELPDDWFEAPPAPIRSGDTLDLAFAGGLTATDDGLDLLLDAMAFTARPHKLDIAGDGPLRAQLELRARYLGIGQRIAFRGPVGDLRAFLRARDLFVAPARTAPVVPAALLIAMAVRLPCLATAVGAHSEALDPDELVPPDEPVALARAIDALAADPARRGLVALALRHRARDLRASEREIRIAAFLRALRAARAG